MSTRFQQLRVYGRTLARIARHLAFVIPAERRSPPESAGRGAFGNSIGEPTTDHAARYYKFESISLQRRVRNEPLSGQPPIEGTALAIRCRAGLCPAMFLWVVLWLLARLSFWVSPPEWRLASVSGPTPSGFRRGAVRCGSCGARRMVDMPTW
jgi:hypothetical protein